MLAEDAVQMVDLLQTITFIFFFAVLPVAYFGLCSFVAWKAHQLRQSGPVFFLVSLVGTPILGAIMLLAASKTPQSERR